MPRANRTYVPGQVWHITHRCHERQFLLKFAKDRRVWMYWLYQARRRFGLCVLNDIVTSNHIHLLVRDAGREAIARSMQLIAGRVARQFIRRKAREGAYWEDRYHATDIESDRHLAQCMVYIDLNMVRAGVVQHPAQRVHADYNEIQSLPHRYRCMDVRVLARLLGFDDPGSLRDGLRAWVEAGLANGPLEHQPAWTRSIAVGQREYLLALGRELNIRHPGRHIDGGMDFLFLREDPSAYTIRNPPETCSPAPNSGSVNRSCSLWISQIQTNTEVRPRTSTSSDFNCES